MTWCFLYARCCSKCFINPYSISNTYHDVDILSLSYWAKEIDRIWVMRLFT